ncbi:MAG TPA: GGDEF domain-containing protein [Desulfuromonadales bacterium]|nr:GGDEF domain-containing protein [Desulfuromonadales bacterium]
MTAKRIAGAEVSSKDPFALLRQLIRIALVSLVVILSLAATGIYVVYSRHVISRAELDAIRIGSALQVLERDALLNFFSAEDGSIAVDPGQLTQLDRRLRQFLKPFDILKIKIFSADGRIVYSTDPLLIGRVDADNRRLQRALTGQVDSRLEEKDEVLDLAEERKFDVDVVETYFPIRNDAGQVIGGFELYVDVTADRRDIAGVVGMSVLLLAAVLLIVFACAFLLVRRGTNQLKAAQDILHTLATTDALTSLLNRHQIFLRAEQEFARLEREREAGTPQKALGLLMLDVDHFKRHNDTYGHQTGDLILKEIADRLVRSLRRYDFVGRYGGEEFLAVLPGTGFDGARAIAERIRERVAAAPVVIDGVEIPVTVSLGLACTVGDGESFEEALKRADDGLYRAKSEGRNRVAWVEGEVR